MKIPAPRLRFWKKTSEEAAAVPVQARARRPRQQRVQRKPAAARAPEAQPVARKPARARAACHRPVQRKPARARHLDVSGLLSETEGSCDSDGPPGLIETGSESDEGLLDVSGLLGDSEREDETEHEDEGNESEEDEPHLLTLVRRMLKQLSSEQLMHLIDNYKVLCEQSRKAPLGVGSGCTGSGMDWFVIKTVAEAHCLFM